jgi:hypothetical protein
LIYEIYNLKNKLGITEAELVDVSAQTDQEILPSGRYVLIRDIKKALEGEDFLYYPKEGGKGVKMRGIDEYTWSSYFTLFSNYKNFGLPHGRGWLNELPWVIDFLSIMNQTYRIVENWLIEKGDTNSNVSPGEVGF